MTAPSSLATTLPGGVGLLTVARATLVLAGLSLLTTGAWVYERNSGAALRPFVVLLCVVGSLAIADGIAAGFANWLSVVWLTATILVPTAFGMFVVEYYGLPYLASPSGRVAFLAVPVAGILGGTLLIFDPSAKGAMVGGGRIANAAAALPPLAITAARIGERAGLYFAGGVMLAASGVMLRTAGTYEHLDRRLAVALSLVVAWPWMAYMATPALVGHLAVPEIVGTTATGYVLSAGVALLVVTRGGLFDAAPAAGTLGPEAVLANLDDPVIVVDRDDRVVRINDAVVDTFGANAAAVVGDPLSSVIGADSETLRETETIELTADGQSRRFEAIVSPVTDRRGRSPGRAVVVRDVTEQRLRAQRLTVLNRVLRHNLRNEMTYIVGRAEVIATEADEHADAAEGILSSAEDLVDIGDRAQEVERMMSMTGEGPSTAVVADVAREVANRRRDAAPDADVSVDVSESLEAAVDPRILARVLDNLVENAIEHNDAPTPVVVVSARRVPSDDLVRLTVSDNGPGIPEQELAALEEGDESPLRHASGLGLWAVSWGVTRMGGTLSFENNDPHGTIVTIRLPRSSEASGAGGNVSVVGREATGAAAVDAEGAD